MTLVVESDLARFGKTRFDSTVLIDLGSGNDDVIMGVSNSAERRILFSGTAKTINGSVGSNDRIFMNNVGDLTTPAIHVLGFELGPTSAAGGDSPGHLSNCSHRDCIFRQNSHRSWHNKHSVQNYYRPTIP